MKLDLHIHTYLSDGQLSPSAVVERAIAAGLDVIAITDHDTAAGVGEARQAARGSSLEVIPGIEVSASYGGQDIHILGYWVDPDSDAMRRHQDLSAERRLNRMRAMVGKLQDLGVPVTYDEVLRVAGEDAHSIGRPHLARALLAGGHTRFYGEAFERYLHDGGPAAIAKAFPGVRESIESIHDAGGLAVWAHPPSELFDREIRRFADWGLDGIECFHPSVPPLMSLYYENTARDLGLLRSGGSDWHGPYRRPLGEFFVRPREVADLLAAAPIPPARRVAE